MAEVGVGRVGALDVEAEQVTGAGTIDLSGVEHLVINGGGTAAANEGTVARVVDITSLPDDPTLTRLTLNFSLWFILWPLLALPGLVGRSGTLQCLPRDRGVRFAAAAQRH